MHDKNKDIEVFDIACPKFVPIVESNQSDTKEAEEVVRETLRPLEGNRGRYSDSRLYALSIASSNDSKKW